MSTPFYTELPGRAQAAPRPAPPLAASLRTALPVWIALAVVLALAVLAKVRFGIPWHHTLGDPATTTGWPFYLGFVSNTGAVLWAATSAIFLFGARLEREAGDDPGRARFLLASGLFVALLGIDDLFLLHDQVFPNYLGIGQALVVGAYGLTGAAYLAVFKTQIARTAWPLLAAALALLAASVGLDQLQDQFGLYLPASGFLEDAAKLLGIGTWLAYGCNAAAARRPYPTDGGAAATGR